MRIIGLTGGSGSGKGAVSEILRELNIPSIDTDLVYRELTASASPCLSALKAAFGEDIISDDGSLNRKKLSKIVFSSADADAQRATLNSIAHRFILAETESRLRELENDGCELAFVDAPVLFESGFDKRCDAIVAVIANKDARINRIVSRDGLTVEMAEKRIATQLSDDELTRLCDYVIVNDADFDTLKSSVIDIVNKIKMNYNLKGDK